MTPAFERAASADLCVAALAIATVVVRREFFPRAATASNLKPSFRESWRDDVSAGTLAFGDAEAKVKIVEFTDFQCSACKAAESRLCAIESRYAGKVSRVIVHLPLPMHPAASDAARTAECARSQGKLHEMIAALYAQQESFGTRRWSEFGRDVGVKDTSAFEQCLRQRDTLPQVKQGLALATKLGITSIPTVIVNGWQFVGVPPDSVLAETIDALLGDKTPRAAGRRWWQL